MRVAAAVVLGCLVGLLPATGRAAGQGSVLPLPNVERTREEVNRIRANMVGLVSGATGGVYAQIGYDLMRLLDDRDGGSLRVAANLGTGGVNNLDDLRNRPGVDFAIIQGDVVQAYGAEPRFEEFRQRLRYVSRLHTEYVHVIARRDIAARAGGTICALKGERVNAGGIRSGSALTVVNLFNRALGLGVVIDDSTSTQEGLDQLETGKVAAVIFVVGRGAPVFANDRTARRFAEGLEWLTIPATVLKDGCGAAPAIDVLAEQPYEAAQLTSRDYPQLIEAGGAVDTLGVPSVLVAYEFPSGPRADAGRTFIERFFQQAPDPRSGVGRAGGGFSSNWCGIDLALPVKGWARHKAAQAWLDAHPGAPTRIDCAAARPSFCSSNDALAAEWADRARTANPPLAPQSPQFLTEFMAFRQRECP
ncbi:TAXI family TRAP transporter solute-binding subunit [Labrys wisconsinensis]|uniref:TRAP-type uncharacterized transport system substrate-binding protein n=1 Tax=Labrys wisconsinensis TaxID=425677 RepID=A0ABU0J5N6_9HYPH|nr:TAXI family TRAP transporter solute-binding subunit [Labrys wisconsinensis]MDQ0469563.1 TRAP-type uncharacterized transport system substrate-binding protein [Labrys wisconsinensis]